MTKTPNLKNKQLELMLLTFDLTYSPLMLPVYIFFKHFLTINKICLLLVLTHIDNEHNRTYNSLKIQVTKKFHLHTKQKKIDGCKFLGPLSQSLSENWFCQILLNVVDRPDSRKLEDRIEIKQTKT
jgi:hypothetical protein